MSHRQEKGIPFSRHGTAHITLGNQPRYLTGHGIEAIADALNGLDQQHVSVENIIAIYIEPQEFNLYFQRMQWPLVFSAISLQEVTEFIDTIDYMLRMDMIRPYPHVLTDADIEKDQEFWKKTTTPSRIPRRAHYV